MRAAAGLLVSLVILGGGPMVGGAPAYAGEVSELLTVSSTGATCTTHGVWFVDWVARSTASEPLTIDSAVLSDPVGGQAFTPNPVPPGGDSVILGAGPGTGGTTTITVTYHGSDNVPRTAMGSTTVGTCFIVPCITAPGECFPTSTTTTGASASTSRATASRPGSATTTRLAAVAARPAFTG